MKRAIILKRTTKRRQNRIAALGRPAIKLQGGGGASTSLRSTNPRPKFCLGSSDTRAHRFDQSPWMEA